MSNNKNKITSIPTKQNTQASKKKVAKKINQSPRNKALKAPFYECLTHPFDPASFGARVPDPFPFPTATYHLHQTTVLGNSTGVGCVAFCPNPILSMIDVGALSTPSNACISSTPMSRYNSTSTSFGFQSYGATIPSTLSGLLASYRVVSWGIKISNLQPELNATGKIIVAMIPHGDTVPSYSELISTVTGFQAVFPIFGTSASALATSSILQLPTAQEFAVQDLLHGDVEVSGMYTNSTFWSFKTDVSNPLMSTTTSAGDSFTYSNSTVIPTNIGYKDLTRMVGGASIVIYFEGMPASLQNTLQIETIYHLEGSPQIAANSNSVPIPSGLEKTVVGSTSAVEQSMALASKPENVFSWITKGADFLNRNSDNISRTVSSVAKAGMFAASLLA